MKYAMQKISESNPMFTTMRVETKQEKARFYNVVQNPTHKMSEYINKEIKIADVYMERVILEREDEVELDGEKTKVERSLPAVKTVIITPEGEGILAHSTGIAESLYSIFTIFGLPSEWDEPLTVRLLQIETPKGRYFKFEVV